MCPSPRHQLPPPRPAKAGRLSPQKSRPYKSGIKHITKPPPRTRYERQNELGKNAHANSVRTLGRTRYVRYTALSMSSPPLPECPIQRDLVPRSKGGLFSPTLPPCFCLILPPCFCLILSLFHPTLVHALGSALIPPQSTRPPNSEACLVSIPFDSKYTFRPAPTAYSSSRFGTSPTLLHPPHDLSASLATRGTPTSPLYPVG